MSYFWLSQNGGHPSCHCWLYRHVVCRAGGRNNLEADIARQLPVPVSLTQPPLLQRASKAMEGAPTVPLLAKGPAQHGGCHIHLDYALR